MPVKILLVSNDKNAPERIKKQLGNNDFSLETLFDENTSYDICLVDKQLKEHNCFIKQLEETSPLCECFSFNGELPEDFYDYVKEHHEMKVMNSRISDKLKELERSLLAVRKMFSMSV